MKLLVLLVIIGVVGLAIAETDYCSKSLCKKSNHIACKNSGDFAKTCPEDRKLEKITEAIKAVFLKKHNEYRNTLARGELKGFEPSSKMATMVWDDELAKLAELNVKSCVFEHDNCHNTDKFSQSGQNLAIESSSEPLDLLDSVNSFVDGWWSEYKDTTTKQINSYPAISPAEDIGHFTVMARESNVAMGCAVSSYSDVDDDEEKWFNLLGACNYATTNIVGKPSYTPGKTASKCETGVNPKYKGLCSENEKYTNLSVSGKK